MQTPPGASTKSRRLPTNGRGQAGCPLPQQRRPLSLSTTNAVPVSVTAHHCAAQRCVRACALELYTSHTYTHRRAVGPLCLDAVPGKGLGWRAARDISTGELLLTSLPVGLLYGAPGDPPENSELAAALRLAWPRLSPLEQRWLLLLADCCAAASSSADSAQPASSNAAESTARGSVDGSATSENGSAAAAAALSRLLLARAEALVREGQEPPSLSPGFDRSLSAAVPVESTQISSAADPENSNSSSAPSDASPTHNPELALNTSQASDVSSPVGGPLAASSSEAPVTPLSILPPAIFGTAAQAAGRADAAPGVASNGGSGGLLEELVARYSYAEAREDSAVAELLDVEPVSCAGVWPEMALINHSCCPNASLLVVGGAMYVRAGRAVLEGEEITVSYLGSDIFADVAERRARLRRSHGFVCCCPRCIMEQEHFPTRRYPDLDRQLRARRDQSSQAPQGSSLDNEETGGAGAGSETGGVSSRWPAPAGSVVPIRDEDLAELLMGQRGSGPLQALLDVVFGAGRFRTGTAPNHRLLRDINEALHGDLEAAAQAVLTAASRPRRQQQDLLARLEAMLGQVEVACQVLQLPPRARLMAYASVYGLVRLTCDLAELSQQAAPERRLQLLQLATEVLEAVAPGSDTHLLAAIKAAGVARRVHGADSVETRRADLAAATAHLACYGRDLLGNPQLLREMMATRRRLLTGSGLAASMGVMAWLQQVGP